MKSTDTKFKTGPMRPRLKSTTWSLTARRPLKTSIRIGEPYEMFRKSVVQET